MIPSRFIGPLIFATAVLISVAWFAYKVREEGAERERAKQEKANAEFVIRANKGAVDFDTCDAAGGLYNFRTGACELP